MAGTRENPCVRVVIVAAARLYREGIARSLIDRANFAVVGLASSVSAALECVRTCDPHVALVDVGLPGSLALVRALRAQQPGVHVVTLSVPEAENEILACAEAGAEGFVTLDNSLDDLSTILVSVGRGEALCPPWIAGAMLRHIAALASGNGGTLGTDLTTREREVMVLVDRGLANKEIAKALHIELPTVKHHVHNILRKLQVSRRSDAITRFRGGALSARDDEPQRPDVLGLPVRAATRGPSG